MLHAGLFERRLDDGECPLDIQTAVSKHGQLEGFRFLFKPDQSSISRPLSQGGLDDRKAADNWRRSGYLEKRCEWMQAYLRAYAVNAHARSIPTAHFPAASRL